MSAGELNMGKETARQILATNFKTIKVCENGPKKSD